MKKILAYCLTFITLFVLIPFKVFASTKKDIDISIIYGGIHDDKVVVFFKFITPKGTKTYWKYSGFGGIAPNFSFSKDLNMNNINILYNFPKITSQSGLLNYVLDQEDYIAVTFEPNNPALPIKLSGDVTYGYCDTLCKSNTYHFNETFDISQKQNKELITDFFKYQPNSLVKNTTISVDELHAKFSGKKNLLVSFQISGIRNIELDKFIYYFDTEFEIKRPMIRKIQPEIYNISMDLYGLYEKPKKIFLLLPDNDKKIFSYEAELP